MQEEWKKITQATISILTKERFKINGDFSASNFGDIKNNKTDHIYKQFISTDGYNILSLPVIQIKDNKSTRKLFPVHRIIAAVWIENPNNFPYVNHKDECKTNNTVWNLEWCTPKYNSNYGTAAKRTAETKMKKAIGSGKSIIQLSLDGEYIGKFNSAKEASNVTGIPASNIYNVCRKVQSYAKGYIFMYEKEYVQYKNFEHDLYVKTIKNKRMRLY